MLNKIIRPLAAIMVFTLLLINCWPVSAETQQEGLLHHKKATSPGYVLIGGQGDNTCYLIDKNGYEVHSWINDDMITFTAYFLENGDLIPTIIPPDGDITQTGFEQISWDGETKWQYTVPFEHHDIEPMPNGNMLLIIEDIITENQAIELGRNPETINDKLWVPVGFGRQGLPDENFVAMPRIIEIKKTGPTSGTIVWEWNLMDHLIQTHDQTKLNYGNPAEHPELIDFNFGDSGADWVHVNSVDYNPKLDQILIGAGYFGEIWIIDHSTTTQEAKGHAKGRTGKGGDILYRWGNPHAYKSGTPGEQQLFCQHDAHWIPPGYPGEGNVLTYNNRVNRHSEVVEIEIPHEDGIYTEPPEGKAYKPEAPLWKFSDNSPDNFNFLASSAQRLANGNTFICGGEKKHLWEVSPEGEILFEYKVPNEISTPFVFSRHLASDHKGLTGKKLIPKGTIEHYESDAKLILTITPGGSITNPGTGVHTYGCGQTATLVANALPFHEFSGWVVESGSISIHTPQQEWTTFTIGNQDVEVTAKFGNRVAPILQRIIINVLSFLGVI